jgi:hypothetical protein
MLITLLPSYVLDKYSAEAANEARKFYKEPKGSGKNEEMEGWS